MRNVSDKRYRETQDTNFKISNIFFFFLNRTVYEITWKNIVLPDRPHITICRMCFPCWIP